MGNNFITQAKTETRLVIIASLLLFIFSGPYFFWWITKNIALKWIATLFLCYIFYIKRDLLYSKSTGARTLFVIAFVFNIINTILKGKVTAFGVLDMIPQFFMLYLLCGEDRFRKGVFHYFTIWFAGLMALSIIAQVLYMNGMLPSIGTIVNPSQDRTYTVYPFLIREQIIDIYNLSGTRFSGAYDEPGAIGTMAAVLLCINKFNLRDWRNIVFLISGLISMSLAFYIILAVYSLTYFAIVKRNILFVLITLVAFGVFYVKTKDDPTVQVLIWDRLEWNADKKGIAGEDRMIGDADYYFEKHIQGTPAFWFGLNDTTEFWKAAEGSSSYKVVIAQSGMIFLFLYLLSFCILAFRHKTSKIEIILFLTLLLANTMQRPNMYVPIWVFLYAYYARSNTAIESKNNLLKT